MKPTNAIAGTEIVVHVAQDGVKWFVCLIPGDQSAWPGSTLWSDWYTDNGVKA